MRTLDPNNPSLMATMPNQRGRQKSHVPKIINASTENVLVTSIRMHPRNANEGDYGAIEESIRINGFYGHLICQRSTGFILAGNHRYKVACDLGYTYLPVDWLDISDAAALKIVLVDNRTNRLGHDNTAVLASILADLAKVADGLTGTGYTAEDVDDLIQSIITPFDAGLSDAAERDEHGDIDESPCHTCPRCGFKAPF